MDKLLAKWHSLAERERWLVGVAGSVIIIFLIYSLIVSPLSNAVQQTQQQLSYQQNLAAWLQPRVGVLQSNTSTAPTKTIAPSELLSTIDQQLKQTSFASGVSEVSQAANSGVRVVLKNVSFDDLAAWLLQEWQTSHIQTTDVDLEKTDKPGIVNVTLILSLATS